MSKAFRSIGEFTPDNLIVGNQIPLLTESITLAQGSGMLERGTIITAEGKAIETDGSPYGILTDNVELVPSGEVSATVYISGEFNSDFMKVATGNVEGFKIELRKLGIYIK